ncbi:MAG: tartrate dehydrogenase [Hyphomicrobiaceae bacterium]|nr:tartrate dehydrogenase [Hyphomicrobiaceae bacterium]
MGTYRIAAIPGDGIGKEVISAGCQVLEELTGGHADLTLEFEVLPWGSDMYLATGTMMPDDALDMLRKFDAIYFGSAGDPRVPDHISLWNLRLAICQGLDQYANIRPTKLLPGLSSPLKTGTDKTIDWFIVRENSEGEYSGAGGRVHQALPNEVGLDVSVITREGAERIQRFALDVARSRPRKKLTFVTKSNAQRHAMVLWDEVFESVSADYPDVQTERVLVDAMAARFVTDPESVDTVVATNLHADVLSDLAAALSGSLGLAPTGNINPERKTPSMFEPIHGSAFDIVGHGSANPLGAIWSASLMLEHLGEKEAAMRLLKAVEHVTTDGSRLPRDLGGQAGTDEVTKAVCDAL